jgi:hypothetical protein
MVVLIEISKGIKTFGLFKGLFRKTISNFYYSVKNSIEKIRFQNTNLHLFKSYASFYLQRKFFTK